MFIGDISITARECVHLFMRGHFRSRDRQTDRHDRNYIPRRFTGGQWNGAVFFASHGGNTKRIVSYTVVYEYNFYCTTIWYETDVVANNEHSLTIW